ncbi:rod-binding protein [Jiella sp. M17.18]|uniref:rod-binding protein n=1 Tax=Jiella sp. M17.18 TaxID=3234247 RepID=UPI0034DF98ED
MTVSSISPNAMLALMPALTDGAAKTQAAAKADTDFAATLSSLSGDAAAQAPEQPFEPQLQPLVKHVSQKASPLEQFEGFVLRSFVESMLPSDASEFFGKGTAGSIWKSMLAEQIGDEIAKNGGIGIAAAIAKKDKVAGSAKNAAGGGADGLKTMLARADFTRAATLKTPAGE